MLLPKDFFIQYLLSRALILRGALGKYSECPGSCVYLCSCPNGPSNVPSMSVCLTVSPALLAIFKGCRRPKAAGLSTNPSKEIVQPSRFFLGKSTFFWRKSQLGDEALINSSGKICLLTPAPLSTGFVELCPVAEWGRASRGQPGPGGH